MNNLILASTSPRRAKLLTELNIKYKKMAPKFEESSIRCTDPKIFVLVSAYKKAFSIYRENQSATVLAADTIVVLDNEILGKPNSRKMAHEMLNKLQGRRHKVMSGVSILSGKFKVTDCIISEVKFKDLTSEKIEEYLDTGEYKDKAGAYAIQGQGSNLIDGYTGDYDNIVGLPTNYVVKIFNENF